MAKGSAGRRNVNSRCTGGGAEAADVHERTKEVLTTGDDTTATPSTPSATLVPQGAGSRDCGGESAGGVEIGDHDVFQIAILHSFAVTGPNMQLRAG